MFILAEIPICSGFFHQLGVAIRKGFERVFFFSHIYAHQSPHPSPPCTRVLDRMGLLDFLNPDYLRDSLIQKGWERKKANVAAHYYGLALEQVIGIFWKEQ